MNSLTFTYTLHYENSFRDAAAAAFDYKSGKGSCVTAALQLYCVLLQSWQENLLLLKWLANSQKRVKDCLQMIVMMT